MRDKSAYVKDWRVGLYPSGERAGLGWVVSDGPLGVYSSKVIASFPTEEAATAFCKAQRAFEQALNPPNPTDFDGFWEYGNAR